MARKDDIPAPELDDAKFAGVHRSLLAGLLGNVGLKNDLHEYTGARGTKFNIFPGSGLFKKSPRWIMAAEIVETTRLYARTVATIKPEWIEPLARHLVHRSYSEPHWQQPTAHVTAYEKVTLYGLPIVDKRLVHYGPIDPKMSREIFIQHALVLGEYRSEGAFFQHNRQLIAEVKKIEARLRRSDLLAGPDVQYAFYDACIPEGIYNGPLFEKWRRDAEKTKPRLLYMSMGDLLANVVEGVGAELFPEKMIVNGLPIPLTYIFEPGHPADGITATIPLAALNQLPVEPFEWLVPGMLREKVIALIKSLPKNLRVNFIPAPDYADAALAGMKFGQGPLLEALGQFLGRRAGVNVPRSAFDPAELLEYLKMNFRVVDQGNKEVAFGRDLVEIRRKLGIQAKTTFASLPPTQFHRDNVTSWDFGDLPEVIEVRREGMTLNGYPSLVDNAGSVSVRLLDSPGAARAAMRAGLMRLFMHQVRHELRDLEKRIPNIDQMSLHYATIGNYKELKQELAETAAERAFFGDSDDVNVRTRDAFIKRAEAAWKKLAIVGREVCDAVAQALSAYQEASQLLSREYAAALMPAIGDMRQQIRRLVPRHFIRITPTAWLKHLPRFIKGILVRLQKLTNAGLARDTQGAYIIAPLERVYLDRLEKHRRQNIADPELETYRWMLEELRISLFAQELKTSIPISAKRLEAQREKLHP